MASAAAESWIPIDTFQGKCLFIGAAHGTPIWVHYVRKPKGFYATFRRDPHADLASNDRVQWIDVQTLPEMGTINMDHVDPHNLVKSRIHWTWREYFNDGAKADECAQTREVFRVRAPMHIFRVGVQRDVRESMAIKRAEELQESAAPAESDSVSSTNNKPINHPANTSTFETATSLRNEATEVLTARPPSRKCSSAVVDYREADDEDEGGPVGKRGGRVTGSPKHDDVSEAMNERFTEGQKAIARELETMERQIDYLDRQRRNHN